MAILQFHWLPVRARSGVQHTCGHQYGLFPRSSNCQISDTDTIWSLVMALREQLGFDKSGNWGTARVERKGMLNLPNVPCSFPKCLRFCLQLLF